MKKFPMWAMLETESFSVKSKDFGYVIVQIFWGGFQINLSG